MYRRHRLTWLAIAALLLQSAAPALTSLPFTAFAAPKDYQSHAYPHSLVMPSTQALLGTKDVPYTTPTYVAPNPADEAGPLLPNGTYTAPKNYVPDPNAILGIPSASLKTATYTSPIATSAATRR